FMSRRFLMLCAGLAACGGQEAPPIASNSAALTAGEAVCQIIDALPATKVGEVKIKDPRCDYTRSDRNLFYFCADRFSIPTRSRSAEGIADALLCALHDADGKSASVTVAAGSLGRFGFDTNFELGGFDPAARTFNGQRVGRAWLFGVPLTIDAQD